MDRVAKFQDQVTFHLTGSIDGAGLRPITGLGLRPAALAGLSDLTRLRYDFPVVLADAAHGGGIVPLSQAVDAMLARVAPRGVEGERLRRQVLGVERTLRALMAQGERGRLSDLWPQAVQQFVAEAAARGRAEDGLADVLLHAGAELQLDGTLHDCDAEWPDHAVLHAWHKATAAKARAFRTVADRLIRALGDILRAAHARSAAGQTPEALRKAIGGTQADGFDFDTLSRLVKRSHPADELPPARRARIEAALAVLRWQPFFNEDGAAMNFVFASVDAAAQAYRQRLPQAVEVIRAIAIAELEAAGRYVPAEHDALFARYTAAMLSAADLALLPDYLVRIPPGQNAAPEDAQLLSLLSSGVPVKVLVQVEELVDDQVAPGTVLPFGVRPARLATTAMGLGGMFVLQAPASALPMLATRLDRGMACTGPALLCVHPGLGARSVLPIYLSSALALDARAFPAFTYDAQAGVNWAGRFSLEGNRTPEADWAEERIDYADDALQRASARVALTLADYALADPARAHHFALVPRERYGAAMVGVAEYLALDERDAAQCVPYVLAVDPQQRLHRVLVDAPLLQATRRALLLWRRLQEHAGIHDSHAERLLAEERARQQQAPAAAVQAAPAVAAATVEVAPAPEAPAQAAADGQAWIETSRCPSCNECQTINPRMFAYNDNKQAFIKDLKAGTYRQLVEAAESCQVAIIHPGKPWDMNEPGLAELIERARPFQ
jgi:ferredoxin